MFYGSQPTCGFFFVVKLMSLTKKNRSYNPLKIQSCYGKHAFFNIPHGASTFRHTEMSSREKVTFATEGKTGRLCIARKYRLHAFFARVVVVPLRIQGLCKGWLISRVDGQLTKFYMDVMNNFSSLLTLALPKKIHR